MAKKRLWSREEFIVVLNLYYKLPFGKLNHTTKEVKELAALIGRTDNSVAMRLSNFAACDVSGSAFIPCIIEKSSNS